MRLSEIINPVGQGLAPAVISYGISLEVRSFSEGAVERSETEGVKMQRKNQNKLNIIIELNAISHRRGELRSPTYIN